jgi:serine/threonine-protein kinase
MTGGSWGDDGHLVVGSGFPGTAGLVRIAAGGGTPSPILTLARGELFHSFPSLLPGRKAALIATVNTPPTIETTNIDIVSLEDGRRKTLVRGGTSPRYLPSGHLLYAGRAGMFAVPFDLATWETRGAAVPIFADAVLDPVTGGAQFDVSQDTLVYRKKPIGAASATMHVQWVDGTGKREALLGKPGLYAGPPRLSPDGRRVAVAIQDGASADIWVYEPQREQMTRVTFGGATYRNPVWSRDGRFIIFGSMSGGLWWTRADGAGQPRGLLSAGRGFHFPTSLSPDGTRLAFVQIAAGNPQIWSVGVSEDHGVLKAGTPSQFLTTPHHDGDAVFSRDGRWIAYDSNESGRVEVYVRPFSQSGPGNENRIQISNSGGFGPGWSPNGRELFYHNGQQIMVVGYRTTDGSFFAEKPRVWADNVGGSWGLDVSPDGRRLAIMLPTTPHDSPRQDHTIVFVQNVLDELRRRAPPGR